MMQRLNRPFHVQRSMCIDCLQLAVLVRDIIPTATDVASVTAVYFLFGNEILMAAFSQRSPIVNSKISLLT
jgi:hypothetical protein